MAQAKRPTLDSIGVSNLFQPSPAPPVPSPQETPRDLPATGSASAGGWEATHRRRTFHCENAVWDRLVAWCAENGVSHSAAITQALEAFLKDRGR